MKKILLGLTAVFALSIAVPAFVGEAAAGKPDDAGKPEGKSKGKPEGKGKGKGKEEDKGKKE